MMGAMVREKIERERERGLQDYLNAVLERCTDDQCLLLAKFLRVNKHLNTPVDAYSNGSGSPAPSLDAGNLSNISHHSHQRVNHAETHAAPVPRRPHGADVPAPQRGAAPRAAGGGHAGAASAGEARGEFAHQQRRVLDHYALRRNGLPKDGDGGGGDGGGAGSGRSTPPRAAGRGEGKKMGDETLAAAKAGVGLFFVVNDDGGLEVDEIIQGSSAHADGRIMVCCVCVCVCVCVTFFFSCVREGEGVDVCVYVCICVYIYIVLYMLFEGSFAASRSLLLLV